MPVTRPQLPINHRYVWRLYAKTEWTRSIIAARQRIRLDLRYFFTVFLCWLAGFLASQTPKCSRLQGALHPKGRSVALAAAVVEVAVTQGRPLLIGFTPSLIHVSACVCLRFDMDLTFWFFFQNRLILSANAFLTRSPADSVNR